MPKQPQVPTGKITAVVDPATEEPEAAIQIKSIHIGAANRQADFIFQFGCDSFVGIHNQHPFMLPWNIFQRPVLLSWKIPIPNELYDSRSCSFRNCLCVIGASGINHYDFLGE